MRSICRIIAFLLVLFLAVPCAAETLTFTNGKETFSADSGEEYLNIPFREDIKNWSLFLVFLGKFPNLKQVDMYDVPKMYYKRVEEIHSRFPDVEFGITMLIGSPSYECKVHSVRTDATAFSTLHGYHYTAHSCKELSILRYCKNLYALDIGHNYLNDLSFLYEMPQLRVLIIAAAGGSLKDITPVGSLKHLEYLEIFVNSIRDISCLKDMPYLMDLNMQSNLIEDISPVKNLKSLKRLWINQYTRKNKKAVSASIIADLQEALPDCYIDGHSSSTDGGWREDKDGNYHPHYEIIRRMFRSQVYEPFADSPAENIPEGFAPQAGETDTAETGTNK